MTTEQYGKLLQKYATPFYVFNGQELIDRVLFLKSHLPADVEMCYAVKANTFISPVIDSLIDRYEVCSPGELAICTEQGISPEKMVISGVYKTPDLIEGHILSEGCAAYYTAESLAQFDLLKASAQKAGKRIKILLRLTAKNQFGMNEEDILNIIQTEKDNESFELAGIQFFSGTQKTSMKKYKRELTHLDEFLTEITEKTGFCVKELEYGTGFPVHYFQGETFDEEAFLGEFVSLLGEMTYDCHITLEIGRSIAASCGYYFTKAVDLKTNHEQNFAIMDGGIHHIAYFGQFMATKHPHVEIYPPRGEETDSAPWNLCGSLCTVNDILVKALPIEDFRTGDTVIFKNAGAYCAMEGISLFLSRALPAVVLIDKDGKDTLLRRHFETYQLNY